MTPDGYPERVVSAGQPIPLIASVQAVIDAGQLRDFVFELGPGQTVSDAAALRAVEEAG